MNVASIDIGSNTVLLLIANISNNKINTILNRYEMPRLSTELLPGKPIKQERINILIDALSKFKTYVENYKCEKVIVTATNAMRIASNSGDIIDMIKSKFNFDVKIIDGNEEARLSFLGASLTLPDMDEKVVIDIGGGSTEIIYGNKNKIYFRKSFQTGVVSLTEKFLTELPYSNNNFKSIEKFLSEIFDEILILNIPPQQIAIGVAGTPTSLSAIHQNLTEYEEEKIEGSKLYLDDILPIYEQFKKLDNKGILRKYENIIRGREDVIFAGTIILIHLMKIMKLQSIYVSEKGVRYGNIVSYIDSLNSSY